MGIRPSSKIITPTFLECSGMSDDQALEIATQGLDDVVITEIVPPSTPKLFQLSYYGPGYQDSYWIYFKTRLLKPGFLKSTKHDRKTGRHMLGNRALLGTALGLRGMKIEPDSYQGAFNWAKTGARIHGGYGAIVGYEVRERLTFLKDRIPSKDYDEAVRLSAFKNHTDWRSLAMMQTPVPITLDEFAELLHVTTDSIRETGFHYNPMPLGALLLVGQSLKAGISFRTDSMMNIFEDYCGVPVRALSAEIKTSLTPPMPRAGRWSNPAGQTAHRL